LPRRKIIGVMGGASASAQVLKMAEELGRRIAEAGLVLLTGGRPAGVMDAASRGAKEAGGLVVGILPGPDPDDACVHADIAIATNLADARNLVNVLSSDVVVACPGGAGTLSEVALAVKNDRPVVLLGGFDPGPVVTSAEKAGRVVRAETPEDTMEKVRAFLR
jgi:uncharacterized protein (TIGR00725 family)